jgi:hypothetical protein
MKPGTAETSDALFAKRTRLAWAAYRLGQEQARDGKPALCPAKWPRIRRRAYQAGYNGEVLKDELLREEP